MITRLIVHWNTSFIQRAWNEPNERTPSGRIKGALNTSNLLRNPLPHKLVTNTCGQCEKPLCPVHQPKRRLFIFVLFRFWVNATQNSTCVHIRHGDARLKSKIAVNVETLQFHSECEYTNNESIYASIANNTYLKQYFCTYRILDGFMHLGSLAAWHCTHQTYTVDCGPY